MTLGASFLSSWIPWLLSAASGVLVLLAFRLGGGSPEGGYARATAHRDRLIDRAPYFSQRRRRAAQAIRAGEKVGDPDLASTVFLLAWEHYWYTFNPWHPRGVGALTVMMLALGPCAALFAAEPALAALAAVPGVLLSAYCLYEMKVLRVRALRAMDDHRGYRTEEDPAPHA